MVGGFVCLGSNGEEQPLQFRQTIWLQPGKMKVQLRRFHVYNQLRIFSI
jgi:hypothetical protein